ncbi:hypothetical protein ACKKBG_A28955 [Auxenochlorella protothecoides x Auxenochlorella symbiontica]
MALGSGAMTAALQRPIWTLPRTLWSPRPRRVDARQSTRPSPRGVIIEAYAVPGPLYITASFDRDRLSGLTPPRLLPNQSFLQFPSRSKDLRWCSRSLLPPNGPLIALQLALVPSEKFECLRSTRGPASWRHTAPLHPSTRREEEVEPRRAEPPLVRVRLHVHYRVHSRQMLCVAGSAIPFGWSFLSIAKVPMSWAPDDLWGVEVELPPGTKLDYKYVILEEQDWTQQVNEAAEGRVQYSYRMEPETSPPDVQHITKQMAIVAWQPGPNRQLSVPTEEELAALKPGVRLDRAPPPHSAAASGPTAGGSPIGGGQRGYGAQALGRTRSAQPPPFTGSGAAASMPPRQEELTGMWEVLTLDADGRPALERRDVWGREEPPPRSVGRSTWSDGL